MAHSPRSNKPRPDGHTFAHTIADAGTGGVAATLAVIAAFAGAGANQFAPLGSLVIILFGLTALFAGGVSSGLRQFLAARGRIETRRAALRRQTKAIDTDPRAEIGRIFDVLLAQGFRFEEARAMAELTAMNPGFAARFLLMHDTGLFALEAETKVSWGGVHFAAFVVFGVVPLAPYFFLPTTGTALLVSLAAAVAALAALWGIRCRGPDQHRQRAFYETYLPCIIGAGVAYAAGFALGL